MRTQDYRLPDGRIVKINADVSRGAQTMAYSLRGDPAEPMVIVVATLVREERVRQLNDVFDRRLEGWTYGG